MTTIKEHVQGLDPNLSAQDLSLIARKTGNVYMSLSIMAKRAKQLSNDMKEELHSKLEEFAPSTDTIEEVHENKEQIEISKFYEKLPHPTIVALHEFIKDEIEYRHLHENADSDDKEGDED